MAETSTMRKWDKRKTIELIRIIFEHKENISDEQRNTEAWNDIVKHLNDKQIHRKKEKVKEKWRSIITEYEVGHINEKAEFYTELKEKVAVILSARNQQLEPVEVIEDLTDDESNNSSSEVSIPINEYREMIDELTCKKLELETHILEIQLNDLKKRASGGSAPSPTPNIAPASQPTTDGSNSSPQGVPNQAEILEKPDEIAERFNKLELRVTSLENPEKPKKEM